jgi:ribosome-binding factor A
MASVRRREKVAEQIHKEVSNLLQFEIKDPRIGFVTVTGVEVNNDLTTAKIFVSIFTEDEAEVIAGLNSAVPFIRRTLGRLLRLRYTPELLFEVDHSLEYAQHIETLLNDIDIPSEAEAENLIDPDAYKYEP